MTLVIMMSASISDEKHMITAIYNKNKAKNINRRRAVTQE